jgi:hypothetical protein
MEIKFNTGRAYTTQGQIIRAKVDTDGSVLFADDSRSIDGRIAKPKYIDFRVARPSTEAELRAYVMSAYDRNEYASDEGSWTYLMKPAAQPDRANIDGATPGASSVLADEFDAQEDEAAADAWEETLSTIVVVAFMQALWEDANGRRRDEEGKKARTRTGYARLLAKVDGFGGPMSDRYRAIALRDYYENETCPVR